MKEGALPPPLGLRRSLTSRKGVITQARVKTPEPARFGVGHVPVCPLHGDRGGGGEGGGGDSRARPWRSRLATEGAARLRDRRVGAAVATFMLLRSGGEQ